MEKRKTEQPWEAVFRRIKAYHRTECWYPPKPTPADLDAAEERLNFRFPLSYRAFAEEFGLGGDLGPGPRVMPLVWLDSSNHWYPARSPSPAIKYCSVFPALKYYLKCDPKGYGQDRDQAFLDFLRRAIVFATGYDYDNWLFDPAEVTESASREYAIYGVNRARPTRGRFASFTGWLDWLVQHRAESQHRAPDAPTRPWEVYKPDSVDPHAVTYFRDPDREKEPPTESDVMSWLAYSDVRHLALAIRDHARADAFPALADALQEAGCTNTDLLDSCRTGDPDIDGVWVLRVLLGGEVR